MWIRIWMMLLSIALVTSSIAASDLQTAEAVELVEPAFDEVVTPTPASESPPATRTIRQVATHAALPPSPAVATIFRPPRLAS